MIKRTYPWRQNILFMLPVIIFVVALHLCLGSEDDIAEFFSPFRRQHPQLSTAVWYFSNYVNILFYPIYVGILINAIRKKDLKGIAFITSWFFAQITIILLLGYFLKIAIGRPRPHIDGPFIPFATDSRHNSFPSGHTSESIINALPLAQHYGLTALYIILSFIVPLMALSRIYLGVHHPSDIIGSLFLGSLAAYVVWRGKIFLEKKLEKRRMRPIS